ncbi:MAG: ABC transporter substrate-binding protein [Spirochaetaceae bacterium]|nr:ABC transporter substrate-binding protein [Spirochaetaceae bacterium]
MKKFIITFLVIVALTFSLFANGTVEDKPLTIGITKIVAHPALDALENGIMEVVLESYPDARFDNQNANGEMSTASTIAQKFKADKVDLAVGIATPTAVALANTISDVPVIFCAVTDPVDAGLVPSLQKSEGNITGISDMTPVKDQISLLAELTDIKALGHVYSSGEANAVRLAELAEEACAELGIEFVPTTVANSAEVKQAAQSIAGRVDAFYVSTDNTVVSALAGLTDAASKAGIPVLSADPSSASENGVLLAWGFDYYKMGLATGRLVVEVLEGADPASIPTRFMTSVDDIDLFVNLDVAQELGIDIPENLIAKAATVVRNGSVETK